MSADKPVVCFIDSNVWFYALLPKQDQIKEHAASRLTQRKDIVIVVSTQVVNEIVANVIKNNAMSNNSTRLTNSNQQSKYQFLIL